MKLSPETRARERPQRYPMAVEQPDLPNMPPPLTKNRALDFKDEVAAAYGDQLAEFHDE